MRSILPLLICLALPACAREDAAPRASVPARPAAALVPDAALPETAAPDTAPGLYVMVRDPRSDAVLPRLRDTADPRFREVNRQLDSLSAELRCVDDVDPFGGKTEHMSRVEVAHAGDGILSVKIHFSGFCGGAHPIKGANHSVTYDLRTGRPVPLRELFADWDRDARAIARALYPEHSATAARLRAEGREPGQDEHEEFCALFYSEEELAQGWMSYWMTDAGLVVEPHLGHAVHACTEESVVPYARLRPFAAPGGLLARMADR